MTVYIEDCLIENYVVTFLILKSMCMFFKFQISKLRLHFACLLASILATFYPIMNFNGFLLVFLKCAVGILIICMAFKNKLVSKYVIFIFFTAIYAGLNIAAYYIIYGTVAINDNFATYILLILLLLIYFISNMALKLIKKQATIDNFIFKVKITNKNNIILTNGFLDSGNTLLDQDSTPIFIINLNLFSKLYSKIEFEDLLKKNYKELKNPHYVKSEFASGGANILVFSVDEVQIEINNAQKTVKNAKLGISYSKFNKNFNCDMLLNINAFV